MRTANPALNENTFADARGAANAMSISGTVNKTAILLALVACGAAYTWNLFRQSPESTMPWMLGGAIGGFIVCMVTIFKKEWSPFTAPLYSVLEGLFLGALSAFYEARFQGIVMQAIVLTFGTLFGLLLAYRSGLIQATQNFRLGVVAATGGIALVYLVTLVLGFFGVQMPYIHESGLIGIGFSLFVVVIAALNLVLDFDFIEQGTEQGAPKYMEWYAAFGLMVTLIWLYIEMLRLLSKIAGRK